MAGKPGRPQHRATKERRKQVLALASFGIRQDQIAAYLEIDPKTLRKHYAAELRKAEVQSNAAIARRLYSAAVDEGSVPAMIFWLKARAGWSERHEVTGAEGGPIQHALTVEFVGAEEEADASDGD